MIFIETSIFTRLIQEMVSDDDYRLFQEFLIARPDSGSVIKGSGGLRKIRWKLTGKGKSGGIRIIYYWVVENDQIFLLYVYKKSMQLDLTPNQIAELKQIVTRW